MVFDRPTESGAGWSKEGGESSSFSPAPVDEDSSTSTRIPVGKRTRTSANLEEVEKTDASIQELQTEKLGSEPSPSATQARPLFRKVVNSAKQIAKQIRALCGKRPEETGQKKHKSEEAPFLSTSSSSSSSSPSRESSLSSLLLTGDLSPPAPTSLRSLIEPSPVDKEKEQPPLVVVHKEDGEDVHILHVEEPAIRARVERSDPPKGILKKGPKGGGRGGERGVRFRDPLVGFSKAGAGHKDAIHGERAIKGVLQEQFLTSVREEFGALIDQNTDKLALRHGEADKEALINIFANHLEDSVLQIPPVDELTSLLKEDLVELQNEKATLGSRIALAMEDPKKLTKEKVDLERRIEIAEANLKELQEKGEDPGITKAAQALVSVHTEFRKDLLEFFNGYEAALQAPGADRSRVQEKFTALLKTKLGVEWNEKFFTALAQTKNLFSWYR